MAASVRVCKALNALEGFGGFRIFWQVWKALGWFLEALGVFGMHRKVWESFGRFWDALGGSGRLWEPL